MGRISINCWIVTLPTRELFQKLNRSVWIVDMSPLLVLARQDMSKTSATAPAELSCQSVSTDYIHALKRYAHKYVVGRTGVVLNTKSEPYSSERSSGGSKDTLLSRRKRDSGLGGIANSRPLRQPRDRRTAKRSNGGDDGGNSDHFSAYSNEMGWMNSTPRFAKGMDGYGDGYRTERKAGKPRSS